jgi:hypothetical protein
MARFGIVDAFPTTAPGNRGGVFSIGCHGGVVMEEVVVWYK